MRIEVIQQVNEFERNEYHFILSELTVVFVKFFKLQKPKGNRKGTVLERWDKYDNRGSSIPEPQLPENIKQAAREKTISAIEVKTWKEWHPSDI